MVTIDVTIELAAPLLVGDWRVGNAYETRAYLPGSALRGAVADTLMEDWPWEKRRVPHPDECPDQATCDFCRVFYPSDGPQPRFGDCYPASPGDHPMPFPLTARTCKRCPGFFLPEAPEEHHGVCDTLVRQAAFEAAVESGKPLLYLYMPDCPVCRQSVTPLRFGWYTLMDGVFYTAQPRNKRFSRTAINRRRGAAESGLLYTLNVIGEQMVLGFLDDYGQPVQGVTTLRGRVLVGEAQALEMQEVLGSVKWLGAGRSRGLGSVVVTARLVEDEEEPLDGLEGFIEQIETGRFELSEHMAWCKANDEPLQPGSLIERLTAFNVAIQDERDFWTKLDVPVLPGWYFTLDLLSDALLYDGCLPTLQLTPEIAGLAGEGLPQVTMVRSWVERTYRSGWSGVKGLPRPVRLAAAAGSVYLYRVEKADREAIQALVATLARLEEDGIGEDQERGAGRVMVCAPFHLEVNRR